jgi:hypothetical protein
MPLRRFPGRLLVLLLLFMVGAGREICIVRGVCVH